MREEFAWSVQEFRVDRKEENSEWTDRLGENVTISEVKISVNLKNGK